MNLLSEGGRVPQQPELPCLGHDFLQQGNALICRIRTFFGDTGQVAAWFFHRVDKTNGHRICAGREHDRDSTRKLLRCACPGGGGRKDHLDLLIDEFLHGLRVPFRLSVGVTVFEDCILPGDITHREKLIGEQFRHGVRAGQIAEQSDAMDPRLALGHGIARPDQQRKNEDKNDLLHADKCRRCNPLRSLIHATS